MRASKVSDCGWKEYDNFTLSVTDSLVAIEQVPFTGDMEISLDDLEQFVNEARAYLGQPVLADEVMKLRANTLRAAMDHVEAAMDSDFLEDMANIGGRINEVLHRMGKLE